MNTLIVLQYLPWRQGRAKLVLFSKDQGRMDHWLFLPKTQRFQPGDFLTGTLTARSVDLGSHYTPAIHTHTHPRKHAVLSTLTALLQQILPEHHPYPPLYDYTHALLADLAAASIDLVRRYCQFEVLLLEQLGFGLDLTKCGATGTTENLVYVSPKTGRAISQAAGTPYHAQLLTYPKTSEQMLSLTGNFIQKHLLEGKALPYARNLLMGTRESDDTYATLPPLGPVNACQA